jgi:hypothetical protein
MDKSHLVDNDIQWIGAFKIDELLDDAITQKLPPLPFSRAIYLVTINPWGGIPGKESIPIYVGANTGKSERFRTRLGDLIADMFGFFQGKADGHHSGGQSIFEYCREEGINPKKLYLGWKNSVNCARCEEYYYYNFLKPLLNRKCPPKCTLHVHG